MEEEWEEEWEEERRKDGKGKQGLDLCFGVLTRFSLPFTPLPHRAVHIPVGGVAMTTGNCLKNGGSKIKRYPEDKEVKGGKSRGLVEIYCVPFTPS